MQEQLQACAQRFVTEILAIISSATLDDLARLRAAPVKPAARTQKAPRRPARAKASSVKAPPIVPQPAPTASGRRDTTLISGRRPPEMVFPPTPDSEPPAAVRPPKSSKPS